MSAQLVGVDLCIGARCVGDMDRAGGCIEVESTLATSTIRRAQSELDTEFGVGACGIEVWVKSSAWSRGLRSGHAEVAFAFLVYITNQARPVGTQFRLSRHRNRRLRASRPSLDYSPR